MDTRSKIVSRESALEIAARLKEEGRTLTVVSGHFDVLRLAHVRDLVKVRAGTADGVVMVVLLPRSDSLLAGPARAELVAGLGMVDYVVTIGEGELDEFLDRLAPDKVVSRQAADEEQTRLLMEHVQGRHSV